MVPIHDPVNDAMRLDEEEDVLGRVDVPQEILVNCHEQLHVSMVIYGAPNLAQVMANAFKIAGILKHLLD